MSTLCYKSQMELLTISIMYCCINSYTETALQSISSLIILTSETLFCLSLSFSATFVWWSVYSLYWLLPSMWGIEGDGLKREKSSSNPGQQVNSPWFTASIPICPTVLLHTSPKMCVHTYIIAQTETHADTQRLTQKLSFTFYASLSVLQYRQTGAAAVAGLT